MAELYCSDANSLPEKDPSNIEANLMTYQEARNQLNAYNAGFSDKPVWLVSMDGLWQHEGPIPESGTVVPLLFNYCAVIIDAETGDMYSLQNKGDS